MGERQLPDWQSSEPIPARLSRCSSASASAQPSESWRSRYCKVLMPCMCSVAHACMCKELTPFWGVACACTFPVSRLTEDAFELLITKSTRVNVLTCVKACFQTQLRAPRCHNTQDKCLFRRSTSSGCLLISFHTH